MKNLFTLNNDVSSKQDSLLPIFKVICNWPANEEAGESHPEKLRLTALEIKI